MGSILAKTGAMVKSAKQFSGKVGEDGVVLAAPLFSSDVIVQKRGPGRTSTASFEDPTEEKVVEKGYDSEEERQKRELERLERERLERERLARLKVPTPEPSSSEESVQPSAEALLEASKLGDLDSVVEQLEAGTEWDCETNVNKRKPLHFAALYGHSKIVAVLLKNKSAVVDVRDRQGYTPLHLAASEGKLAIVQQLLTGRAKVDSVNRYGETALMMATYWGHKDVVRVLLAAGADAGLRAVDGEWKGKRASDFAHDWKTRWLISWKAVSNTQTDEVNALRKVVQFVPEIPDDETVVYESEPEEEDVIPPAPPEEEEAKGKGKGKAGAKAKSPTRTKSPASKK